VTPQTRRILIGVMVAVLVCLLAAVVLLLVFNFSMPRGWMGRDRSMPFRGPAFLQRFDSNGERIYFTARSASGQPIRADVDRMQGMQRGGMACVDCHGEDGRGGVVRIMMMERFEAPDIRYKTLAEEDHAQEGQEENDHDEHPPYTDETLKRAITEGIDPAGEPLDWPMPRWQMDESDLDDLIAYLKTLD
jgi:cytochrome c oxidase subunit II